MGDGNINSSIMLIGEAPGAEEDKTITTFQGDVGKLLDKMLLAIEIKKQSISYFFAINFCCLSLSSLILFCKIFNKMIFFPFTLI